MKWQKHGLIYNVDGLNSWAIKHAQIPTVDYTHGDTRLRIYYSSRDSSNCSRTSFIDVNSANPKEILYIHDKPILELGEPGTFDDCGIMPSWIVSHNGFRYLYYIGWNVRNTVPYHNSIGLAVSSDEGWTFNKIHTGPIMDRTASEPYFCATSCVLVENGVWRNWYLSCTGWIYVNGKQEPRYHLKYAESADGVHWERQGVVAIDYANEEEGGIVRASVLKIPDGYLMWYSYRGLNRYRTESGSSYRIGFAKSKNGLAWTRLDHLSGIEPSSEGWDSFMVAYPQVINVRDKIHMFYNGNGFGETGFGFASLDHQSARQLHILSEL